MLLRFILLSVLAWFIFRWLDGFFGPRSGHRGGRWGNETRGKRPGSTAKGKERQSRVPKDVGEYIDFEEVDNDPKS